MNERNESLIQDVLEKLNIYLQYENEEHRRAELKRQAKFILEREKQELSEKEENVSELLSHSVTRCKQ